MIAVIKYNAGNIRSMLNALNRLESEAELTDNPETIKSADKVIFPGVGEANTAMTYLKEKRLDQLIVDLKQPFLGVCLGMQLLCSYSEENDTTCLGLFAEKVRKFPASGIVPHMGWNNFTRVNGELFDGISKTSDMYFVHSYYVEPGPDTIGETDYLLPFSSAIQKDNFYGVQFHPEKSAEVGEKLLKNFLKLERSF